MSELWADTMDPDRFARAVAMAGRLHRHQLRKGTRVPYLSHLLSVAALVAEDEGTEDEVLAAVLHDAAEDQGGEKVLHEIAREFGSQVAGIVRECSDSLVDGQADKAPWRERKEGALRLLPTRTKGALRVIAADKLHNTRATAADVALIGPSCWDRFKTGREGFIWYHEQMAAELNRLPPDSRSVVLLRAEIGSLAN